jgi:hypothetical protein
MKAFILLISFIILLFTGCFIKTSSKTDSMPVIYRIHPRELNFSRFSIGNDSLETILMSQFYNKGILYDSLIGRYIVLNITLDTNGNITSIKKAIDGLGNPKIEKIITKEIMKQSPLRMTELSSSSCTNGFLLQPTVHIRFKEDGISISF